MVLCSAQFRRQKEIEEDEESDIVGARSLGSASGFPSRHRKKAQVSLIDFLNE